MYLVLGVHLVPGVCTWLQGCVPGPRGMYLVPGGVPGPEGVPGPGGCTWLGGVSGPGDVPRPNGDLVLGCVPGPGRYLPGYSPL